MPGVTPVGKEHSFPAVSNDVSIEHFLPGCYKMIVTALDSLDNNLSNDQIYSHFYIGTLSVDNENDGLLQLAQAYPNPAADFVTIAFTLAEHGSVSLRLVDMQGISRQVITEKPFLSGQYSEQIDVRGIPDGVYLCELIFSGGDTVRRLAKTLVIAK